MPQVDAPHPEYEMYCEAWQKCRDVIMGGDRVKECGQKYLPALTGQSSEAYHAYKLRSVFFEAASRTVEGFVGGLFRRDPKIVYPVGTKENYESLTPKFLDLRAFMKHCSREVLNTGKLGILVDVGTTNDPYIVTYRGEDIINWWEDYSTGQAVLKHVVLHEETITYSGFDRICLEVWRVLRLDEEGYYKQELWRMKEKNEDTDEDEFVLIGETWPKRRGEFIKEIPFFFASATGNSPRTEKPPLLALVNVNISHYCNSADLENGRHFTGIPTAWLAGFDPSNDGKLIMGSSAAWVSDDPNAKAGFLEFQGQGLSTIENGMREKENMMQILGGRLLEYQSPNVEAAETHKLKRFGENSILTNIGTSISKAVTMALHECGEWAGWSTENLSVTIQGDFSMMAPEPALIRELIGAVQSGMMSYETLFHNMQAMGMYPEGVTSNEEKDLIDASDYTLDLQAPLQQPASAPEDNEQS